MCPFDPMDYFLYDEFLEPDREYECPYCGTRFGNECVAWSEEDGCQAFTCPGCGGSGVVEQ